MLTKKQLDNLPILFTNWVIHNLNNISEVVGLIDILDSKNQEAAFNYIISGTKENANQLKDQQQTIIDKCDEK